MFGSSQVAKDFFSKNSGLWGSFRLFFFLQKTKKNHFWIFAVIWYSLHCKIVLVWPKYRSCKKVGSIIGLHFHIVWKKGSLGLWLSSFSVDQTKNQGNTRVSVQFFFHCFSWMEPAPERVQMSFAGMTGQVETANSEKDKEFVESSLSAGMRLSLW